MSVAALPDRHAHEPLPPRSDPAHLAELETELTTLTGHINAAIARFLIVLEEFDRLEGYKAHGLVSSAHWLHWRCGFGLNAAREKVRVARALPELPQVRASFETGILSYSKVRAMTRIATPENELVLLQVARHGTTRHVETLVSKWRGAERAREIQRAGRQHAVRSLRWHYDDDGCLVIRATLPPEQGALVIEALQAALARLDGGAVAADVDADADRAERDRVDGRPDDADLGHVSGETSHGSGMPAASCVSNVSSETSEGNDVSVTPGHSGVSAETSVGPMGDDSSTELPGGGVSSDTSNERIGDGGSTRNRGGGVSAETRAGVDGDEPIDATDAADVSAEMHDVPEEAAPTLGQRRADALVFLAESWLSGDPAGRRSGDGYLVNVHIDPETLAAAAAGRSELADGPGLAAETVRRLCCDGGLVAYLEDAEGETLDVGRRTRAIPPAIRRALRHRDPCCRFPGCTRTRWLDGHHVVHWADGGQTSLENLVHLCRHHHRLVHEGGFGVHVDPAAGNRCESSDLTGRTATGDPCDGGPGFVFTTPAGAVLPSIPTAAGLGRPLRDTLEAFQLKRGLKIDAGTADCRWNGESMDYDSAGWLLMQAADRAEAAGTHVGD